MKRSKMIEVLVLLVISLGFSGCIGFQPFPLAARPGDTISLALGGSPSHETVAGSQITLNDIDVTINQNGNSYPVKTRYLFRLYPDLTSKAANFGFYSEPVGEWSLVLDLVDRYSGAPLPLVGDLQAEIVINTTKLKSFWNNFGTWEGTLLSIPIYILPGTGQSHNFNDNPALPQTSMNNLQPLPQLVISFAGSGSVAAVDLDIDYNENVLNESFFKIIRDISQPNVILNQRVYSVNGNEKMRIMLMTNQGTIAANQLKCFVVWDPDNVTSSLVTAGSFSVTPKFYNESGSVVTGIGVVKTLLYQ